VLVLALDTATPTLVAGLARWSADGGAAVLAERAVPSGTKHAELLTPTIRGVLADAGLSMADVEAVVAGLGPGPFTGLRVGVVTAVALADARRLPAVGVCSLDAIGTGARTVVTDARRKEVYWAWYDAAGRRLEGPLAGAASSIGGAAGLTAAGGGAQLYPEAFGEVTGPAYPDARTLCEIVARRLGGRGPDEGPPLLPAEPLYLRRPDAREPGPPKRVTPW
jgi:tRNA threonylcarbamoyl adenosine modification protein YeaZ